jgi:DNA-binding NarL/FixJ family response regulator
MTTAPRLRVLVLHDATLDAPAVSELLVSTPAFETIARTTDVVRAIGTAPDADARRTSAVSVATHADVIVVALTDETARLADGAVTLGIETLADIGVPVVLLLGFGNESSSEFARAIDWVRKHVRAILSIDATGAELSAAIFAASAGLIVLEPRVAEALTQMLVASRRRAGAVPASSRPAGSSLPLSAREREVLALLAEGHATKNIAHTLGISSHTVKAHVESIFEKFGATTRAEAVAIGVRRGAVML